MPRDDGLPTRLTIGLGPDGDPVIGLPVVYDERIPNGTVYIMPFGPGATWDDVADGATAVTSLDGVEAPCSIREPS